MVLEPSFVISAFFEDVLNEITTFAFPEAAKRGPKSLQSLPGMVRDQFQTPLDSRIDFWTLLSALAGEVRTPPPRGKKTGGRSALISKIYCLVCGWGEVFLAIFYSNH